jgi:hypothetical protein
MGHYFLLRYISLPAYLAAVCRSLGDVKLSYRVRLHALHLLAGSLQSALAPATSSSWGASAAPSNLYRRPLLQRAGVWKGVGLPRALLHRPGNIGLAGALLVSSSIIRLAHLPLHCPDIIGLTGHYFSALTSSGCLGHCFIALEFVGRQLGSRTIELTRRPFTALSAVAYMYTEKKR